MYFSVQAHHNLALSISKLHELNDLTLQVYQQTLNVKLLYIHPLLKKQK